MRATGLVAALALLWGSGFFWIKLSLGGFTPVQITFTRLALGALVLVPIVLIRRLPRPDGARMWGQLANTPLWTVILAALVGSDSRLTRRTVVGVVLGFLGIIVVYEPWNNTADGTVGIIACIEAAASYGLSYIYQGRFLANRGLPPLTLTAAQLTAATAIMAIALPFGGRLAGAPATEPIVAILILGIAGTGPALIINFTLIATEGHIAASVVTYLMPAVALTLGITVLGEPARWTLPIGAVLILAGVALVRRAQTAAPPARPGRSNLPRRRKP